LNPESTELAGSAGHPIAQRALLLALSAGLVFGLGAHLVAAQSGGGTRRSAREAIPALQPYAGVYRLGGDHRLGIDGFKGYEEFLKRRQAIIASGKPWLLSYESRPLEDAKGVVSCQWVGEGMDRIPCGAHRGQG
jgi:hypothetical protein